jgi:hypothetical protein
MSGTSTDLQAAAAAAALDDNDCAASTPSDEPSDEPVFDALDANQDVVGKLIESQVSGIVECLREAAQNGTDKPSADYVGVLLTEFDAMVYDDGATLDFTSEADRDKFLELGTSVKNPRDSHVVGEHGLGSATLMSMGALKVWSGNHILCIDYHDGVDDGPFSDIAGYRTATVETDHAVDGVLVHCQFYPDAVDLSNRYDVRNAADRLRDVLAFRPMRSDTDICVNGASVPRVGPASYVQDEADGATHAAVVLTEETDDAFIALTDMRATAGVHEARQVDVFSNGIYVESRDISGVSGVVVTKRNLSLPISRSTIKDDCPIWGRIHADVDQLARDLVRQSRAENLDGSGRRVAATRLAANPTPDRRDRALFKTVADDLVAYTDLCDAPGVGYTTTDDRAGTNLHDQTDYIVLASDDRANRYLASQHENGELPGDLPRFTKIDPVDVALEEGCIEQADRETDLSPRQRTKRAFARALLDGIDEEYDVEYAASVGVDDDTPAAWTDGEDLVVLSDAAIPGRQWPVWTHQVLRTLADQLAYSQDTRRIDSTPSWHGGNVDERVVALTPQYRDLIGTINREGLTNALSDYR